MKYNTPTPITATCQQDQENIWLLQISLPYLAYSIVIYICEKRKFFFVL